MSRWMNGEVLTLCMIKAKLEQEREFLRERMKQTDLALWKVETNKRLLFNEKTKSLELNKKIAKKFLEMDKEQEPPQAGKGEGNDILSAKQPAQNLSHVQNLTNSNPESMACSGSKENFLSAAESEDESTEKDERKGRALALRERRSYYNTIEGKACETKKRKAVMKTKDLLDTETEEGSESGKIERHRWNRKKK